MREDETSKTRENRKVPGKGIHPEGLENLARAVLAQAGRDARGHGARAAEARAWLVLEGPAWLDVLGITVQPSAMWSDLAALPDLQLTPIQALFCQVIKREVEEWTK